jgi:hypothetical protein
MRDKVHRFLDLPDEDLARELGYYLLTKMERAGPLGLGAAERVLAFLTELEMEVNNGGFDQYYWNSPGDHAHECVRALEELGASHTAGLLVRANGVFGATGPDPDRDARWKQMAALPEDAKALWYDLDGAFYEYEDPLSALAAAYARRHRDELSD